MKPSFLRGYPWRTFLVLWLAGTLTGPLLVPYMLGLTRIATNPPDSLTAEMLADPSRLALGMMLWTGGVLFVATGLGLLIARRLNLGAPYLESWLDGAEPAAEPFRSIVRPALFWAVVTGLLAFAVDALFLYGLDVSYPAPEIHARIDVAPWRSGLASVWAPFYEEIVDRLFLLSLVAWLGVKLFRVESDGGRTVTLWVANAATALFFGWYHISNEELFSEVVPVVVAVRTVLIIAPIGLAFGWLYFRRGLEAAILSHFFIDILVHVLRPVVEGWLT